MLTVLLATKNSEKKIARTLNSLTNVLTEEPWKLIVIDNGSNDSTNEVVNSYKDKLPLTLLHEEKPGKNNALNTSLSFIEGDLVIFIDDDVYVDKNCFIEYRKLADENESVTIFGGQIIPEWEVTPPKWLVEWAPIGMLYAVTSFKGNNICDAGKIWGPNMAIRSSVFLNDGFKYSIALGPDGTSNYPMGSETEFTVRLQNNGYIAMGSDKPKVLHTVQASTMNIDWVLGRAYRLGKGVSVREGLHDNAQQNFKDYSCYRFYQILKIGCGLCFFNKRSFWIKYKVEYYKGKLKR